MEISLDNLREVLRIKTDFLDEINDYLLDPNNPLVNNVLNIIDEMGGVAEINNSADSVGKVQNLISRLDEKNSQYFNDLEWLINERDDGSFITISDYRKKILGNRIDHIEFNESYPVTLEISACNFFPFLIEEAKKSIKEGSLMPARYIRVRSMVEQVEDNDILAFTAAMKIIGASNVQTLDTKGTALGPDGYPVNIHLGGPDTITGYFGGIGVPNHYSIEWIKECLHYYTNYGINEVLNINPGTVILGYILYKLGININFKISVFMGNDNPYSCLWTLMTAKLFSREDGTTPLIGFNLSNAVDNYTMRHASLIRNQLGFESNVRLEHHIIETWKSIVRQPYDRLEELLEIADEVKNISAKHEGGICEVEENLDHPSDILDYFISKTEIIQQGLMPKLQTNYLFKHDAVNRTAEALTKNHLSFIAAQNLHLK
jgi:hypothetical protein